MSTAAPPPDMLDGDCSDNNMYFWGYFGSSVFLSLLIMYCRHKFTTPPKYTGPDCKPDYGRPYSIGILLYHIALWNMAPQAAYFFLFHVLSSSTITMQEQAACINMVGIPFVSIVLFAQCTLLLVAYRPNAMKEHNSGVILPPMAPDDEKLSQKQRVLVLGMTGRGSVFIDGLEKERDNKTNVQMYTVDFSHTFGAAFVRYNARAANVADLMPSRFHLSIWKGRNKFILPFEDHFFDRVIIAPFVRNAQPVGDFMTGDDTKIPRMVRMLREGMRVLKPEGEIFAYDQAANIVPLWADLRDAGYDATIVDNGAEAGPVFYMNSRMLKLHCPYQLPSADAVSPLSPVKGGGTIQNNAKEAPLVDPDDDEAGSSHHIEIVGDDGIVIQRDDVAEANKMFSVMVVFQLSLFLVLMYIATALYSPLSVPTSIPLSQRINNLFVNVATSYPMMAYFSRDTQLTSENPPRQIAVLLKRLIVSEGLAIVFSIFFTVLLGIPTLVIQLALVDSSLSDDTKSLIGIGISFFIGMVMYKQGRRLASMKMLSRRSIPSEYHLYY